MAPDAPAPARITQRICEAIKGQIASGLLGPGARLPSTRSLAAEWGVSRTTVTAAYEQLIAEGYLETRQGARARVAQGLGPPAAAPGPPAPSGASRPAVGLRPAAGGVPATARARPDRLVADFRYGDLAAADFPLLAWRKAVTGALLRRRPRLRYGDPRGSPDLRMALQGYLWRARGLRCEPDQIVVVNGSQQGLDLCARLLLDPGDRVADGGPGLRPRASGLPGGRGGGDPRRRGPGGHADGGAARGAAGLRHAVPPVPARRRHVGGAAARPPRLGAAHRRLRRRGRLRRRVPLRHRPDPGAAGAG